MKSLFYASSMVVLALSSESSAQIITERVPTTSPTVYVGAPPQYFRVESATPARVSFVWSLAYGINMVVLRSTGAGQPWTTLTPTPLPANAMKFTDPTVDYRLSYIYRLQVNYSSGPPGYADIPVTIPQPANPTGFTAKQTGEGTAELSWQAVPNASYYWIWGPGTGTEGVRADGTTKTLTGTGSGPKEWFITTRYDPAGVLLAQSTWPRAILNMTSMSGNYRITLNGFQVNEPTNDVVLALDGAGSEIFSWSFVRIYDRSNGAVLNKGVVQSAVHGDTEGFGGRVPAGSMKPTGGLRAGDKYPSATPWSRSNSVSTSTFPLLLWEGSLTEGKEAIVLTPLLYEWNGAVGRDYVDHLEKLEQRETTLLPTNWAEVSPALRASSGWAGPTVLPLTWGDNWGPTSASKQFKDSDFPRPIGGTPSARDRDVYEVPHIAIVVTRELIEKALSSTTQIGGMAPGVIQVKWADSYPGSKGSYVLYLQVARQ